MVLTTYIAVYCLKQPYIYSKYYSSLIMYAQWHIIAIANQIIFPYIAYYIKQVDQIRQLPALVLYSYRLKLLKSAKYIGGPKQAG